MEEGTAMEEAADQRSPKGAWGAGVAVAQMFTAQHDPAASSLIGHARAAAERGDHRAASEALDRAAQLTDHVTQGLASAGHPMAHTSHLLHGELAKAADYHTWDAQVQGRPDEPGDELAV